MCTACNEIGELFRRSRGRCYFLVLGLGVALPLQLWLTHCCPCKTKCQQRPPASVLAYLYRRDRTANMAVAISGQPRSQTQIYKRDGEQRTSTVFRPPPSPVSSSSSSARQQANSRKRSRPTPSSFGEYNATSSNHADRLNGYFDKPTTASQATTWSCITPNASFEPYLSCSANSPAPLQEARYGITYGAGDPLQGRHGGESETECRNTNVDRRGWMGTGAEDHRHCTRERPSEPNGAPSGSAGLTSLVFGVVTGMAGRMLEFCRFSTGFQGFHAGGGQGFTPGETRADAVSSRLLNGRQEEPAVCLGPTSPFEVTIAPIPGQYPESPPWERSAKRARGDDTCWVLVSGQNRGVPTCTEAESPAVANAQPQLVRRTSSMNSTRQGASRRDPRRSLAPTMVARRHSSNATHVGSPLFRGRDASTASSRASSQATSPARLEIQRASHGSRPNSALSHQNDVGPGLSPDARKYQARVKRQEREQDKSMRQMNAKLQALIAEGQAALGTTIDVDGDDSDFT